MNHGERMVAELEELAGRVKKLHDFIEGSSIFLTLSEVEQELMQVQLSAMTAYAGALNLRVRLALDADHPESGVFTESGDYPPSLMDVQEDDDTLED